MVLEQIYSVHWLKSKPRYTFLLGVTYSLFAIFLAILIFPKNLGLVSIALTSLIILPSLNKLMELEENEDARRKVNLNLRYLFTEHIDVIKVYLFLFLGIMFTYTFFSVVFPSLTNSAVFQAQIELVGEAGKAIDWTQNIPMILGNNFRIMLFCLLTSFIYGSGAVFILAWNASAWGVILGIIIKNGSLLTTGNPVVYILITFIAVFPHIIAEASAYFLVAISGGIISKASLREKFLSSRFKHVVIDGLAIFVVASIILIIAAVIEANFASNFMAILHIQG